VPDAEALEAYPSASCRADHLLHQALEASQLTWVHNEGRSLALAPEAVQGVETLQMPLKRPQAVQ
jgi:hypothetical protein